MKTFLFIVAFLSIFNPIKIFANEKIVTSMPVIASIVKNITGSDVDFLIRDKSITCAEEYQLKPSDALIIKDADIIILTSPKYEPFSENIKKIKKDTAKIIVLEDISNLNLLKRRKGGLWAEHHHHHHDDEHHEHEEEHNNEHHEEHESAENTSDIDFHFWLSPLNAETIASFLANKFGEIYPEKKDIFMKNLASFKERLYKTSKDIEQTIANNEKINYLISHDSLQYFENYFKISGLGAISEFESGEISIKRAIEIENIIKENHISLILVEGEKYPKGLDRLKNENNLKIKNIDIIGTNFDFDENLYFKLLEDITNNIYL